MNIYHNRANSKWLGTATILLSVFLSACASLNSKPQQSQQAELIAQKIDAYVLDTGGIRHDIKDENVARLWQESQILHRGGEIEGAMAKLQAALEITPRDPVLWSRAAEFALDIKSNLRAENYAAKSNFLTTLGNRPLRYRNWLIIQRSREGRGDLLGAREAEIESTKLNSVN